MSEQSEREAYNEAAREDHEGREREAMDRPMFTQRDMDAAVQGEREACARIAENVADDLCPPEIRDTTSRLSAAFADTATEIATKIRARGTSPAVDVMAVVRRYVKARRAYDAAWLDFDAINDSDAHSVDPFAEELGIAGEALAALVAASPKAEEKDGGAKG